MFVHSGRSTLQRIPDPTTGRAAQRSGVLPLGGAALMLAWLGGITPGIRADTTAADCRTCHRHETRAHEQSIHRPLRCQDCHGGAETYEVDTGELSSYLSARKHAATGRTFDHGGTFRAGTDRAAIPDLCGDCHADVERMNPYGLRTDQLMRYWTSVHGKQLQEKGDTQVAVCTDCHGTHDVLPAKDPDSRTHPLNVPETCARCHADPSLMSSYDLPAEIVEEYRRSVHGQLLAEGDTGAPTCATCHGNHSAVPPGFASVGAVCGQCHQHAAEYFQTSVHAQFEDFRGCVQCHGGGEGRHQHLIERITNPAGLMIRRYAHLLRTNPQPSEEEIVEAIHPYPRQILERVLPSCTDCHEDVEEDESLPKLFQLLDRIAEAERYYVQTAHRVDQVGRGVLLVEKQRFKLQDAKTHLIAMAPLQHTLDNEKVEETVAALRTVCDEINTELDALERGLRWRRWALIPIWAFALLFSGLLYAKYRRLKAAYVKPLP